MLWNLCTAINYKWRNSIKTVWLKYKIMILIYRLWGNQYIITIKFSVSAKSIISQLCNIEYIIYINLTIPIEHICQWTLVLLVRTQLISQKDVSSKPDIDMKILLVDNTMYLYEQFLSSKVFLNSINHYVISTHKF